MKPEREVMTENRLSRRRILQFAGAGIVAGIVGSAGLARASLNNMVGLGHKREIDILVHLADTDYSESIMKNAAIFKGMNADLLMRSYTYIDYGKTVSRTFRKVHPHTEISKVLSKSRVVVSTCCLTLIEAQKKGAVPIYLNDGKASDLTIAALEAQHIDVVDLTDRKIIVKSLRHSLWQSRATRRV